MPLVAEVVSKPPSEPPLRSFDSDTVSLPLKPVVRLPSASSAATVIPNALPAVTVEGFAVINNCATAPGVTEIALLVTEASVPLVAASV